MPLMNSFIKIDTYTTDFGTTIKDLPVKMLEGFSSRLEDEYSSRGPSICGGSGSLFRPRALVATFSDGKRVRYPIGNRSNLVTRARTLLAGEEPTVVCIDYEGEYWPFVPSSLFTGNYAVAPLPGFDSDGRKKTGTFTYSSDILGSIPQPFSFERTPAALLTSAEECVDNLEELGFCSGAESTGVRARRLRGKGIVDGSTTQRRTYSRDIKISATNPTNCASSNAENYFCFSYIGEIIKNVHRLLPVLPTT